MEAGPLDRMWDRGRTSARSRVARWRSKWWQIGQCAVAAGVAWLIAADLFGHTTPFFAPVAAVVALGTSYGQRLRRVVEVTIGVAVGVFLADLLVAWLGSGWWQIALIVALSMSAAFLLDSGQLLVTQAAVQSIVVAALVPDPGAAFTRWTDAVIGGGVALLAATAVPAAPLRRPRGAGRGGHAQGRGPAARCRGGDGRRRGRAGPGPAGRCPVDRLPDPRAPGRRRRGAVGGRVLAVPGATSRRPGEDVGARRPARPGAAQHPGAGAADGGGGLPPTGRSRASYSLLALRPRRRGRHWRRPSSLPTGWRSPPGCRCSRSATPPVAVERTDVLAAEAVLAQLRSVVVDLLMVSGLGQLESTDALPPPPR